jgi:dephospho-CoA kinase
MKIIGLTGGIGSGKSTVLQFFKENGAIVYIADIEAKKLMNSDEELRAEIINLLGEKGYQNNVIDRKYIADVVFNDKEKLKELNKLVHPKVQQHFLNFVKEYNHGILIYESAILFESGSDILCDYVITVYADYKAKIERLKLRDSSSEEEIKARMQYQLNENYKLTKANFIIKNNDLKNTIHQVSTIYKILQKEDVE